MLSLIMSAAKEPPIPDFDAPQTLGSPLILTFVVLVVVFVLSMKFKKLRYFGVIAIATIVGFGIGIGWYSPISWGFAFYLMNIFLAVSGLAIGLFILLKKLLLQARTQQ